ncbi:hypothetical protein G9464_15075 [Halostella sp. JP-L12]|uniref:hypothetical protein n=1 Tax=Halostella TaxID=1843185 RepID=UPI000EF75B12|nr:MULTISPECIES: hypothetical protein [Halostella]NHN48910.1 hypothetical protein [Halostella sp. JP-L12]
MDADPDAVRERATVTHLEPPLLDIEEEMWSAEDPETGCVGYGRVEAEAVGNLVAVVAERAGESEVGYVKLPGEVVERTWRGERDGVVSKLSDLF